MMGIDTDYDPDELEKRKKEYIRQQSLLEVPLFPTHTLGADGNPYQAEAFNLTDGPDKTTAEGFNKTASKIDPANKAFVDKQRNNKMLKQAAVGGAGMQDMLDQDVGFKMMKKLMEAGERPKQLKIFPAEKLLFVKDEALSKAFVESLANTARGFGSSIQRIVLDNLGMKDDDFATILISLRDIKSFKSIVYRKNAVGDKSAELLGQLFRKRIPNHLEELRIENCHPFSATAVETIVNSLHEQNSLKVLGLVST